MRVNPLPLAKFSANKGKEAENSSLGVRLEGAERGNKAKSGGHCLAHPAQRPHSCLKEWITVMQPGG